MEIYKKNIRFVLWESAIMIYQLPNGKVIQITIDQYLDLTDEDIQYLMSINYGDYARSPWLDSAISRKNKRVSHDPDKHDESIDYLEDADEKSNNNIEITSDIPLDDLSEIPDDQIPD